MIRLTLKDLLKDSLEKRSTEASKSSLQAYAIRMDTEVACNIVDHIFRYIDLCLRENKSKVEINLFTKSFIRSILSEKVKNGITDFIVNMNDKEVKSLLDDIQKELGQRYPR